MKLLLMPRLKFEPPPTPVQILENREWSWLAQEYGMIIVERSSSERIPPRSRKFGETGSLGAIPIQKGDCSGCSRMAHSQSQSSHSDDSVHSPSSFLSSPSEICSLHPSIAASHAATRLSRRSIDRCSLLGLHMGTGLTTCLEPSPGPWRRWSGTGSRQSSKRQAAGRDGAGTRTPRLPVERKET